MRYSWLNIETSSFKWLHIYLLLDGSKVLNILVITPGTNIKVVIDYKTAFVIQLALG